MDWGTGPSGQGRPLAPRCGPRTRAHRSQGHWVSDSARHLNGSVWVLPSLSSRAVTLSGSRYHGQVPHSLKEVVGLRFWWGDPGSGLGAVRTTCSQSHSVKVLRAGLDLRLEGLTGEPDTRSRGSAGGVGPRPAGNKDRTDPGQATLLMALPHPTRGQHLPMGWGGTVQVRAPGSKEGQRG